MEEKEVRRRVLMRCGQVVMVVTTVGLGGKGDDEGESGRCGW